MANGKRDDFYTIIMRKLKIEMRKIKRYTAQLREEDEIPKNFFISTGRLQLLLEILEEVNFTEDERDKVCRELDLAVAEYYTIPWELKMIICGVVRSLQKRFSAEE